MRKMVFFVILSTIIFFSESCKKKENSGATPDRKVITGNFVDCNGSNNFCETADHGFAFTQMLSGGNSYVAKYSSGFSLAWESVSPGYDNAGGICTTSEDGLVIIFNIPGVSTGSSVDIEKLSNSGTLVWKKRYYTGGGNGQDYTVREVPDKGFIILMTNVDGISPVTAALMKVNSAGDSIWYTKLNGPGGYSSDFKVTPDGGVIVTGTDYLMKTDSLGKKQWLYESPFLDNAKVLGLADGSSVVLADRYLQVKTINSQDVVLMKFDALGNNLWEKPFDFREKDFSGNLSLSQDGGFVFTVQSNDTVRAVKTDAGGNRVSVLTLPGTKPLGLVLSQGKFMYFGIQGMSGNQTTYDLLLYSFAF
jgi:hypothetical protein